MIERLEMNDLIFIEERKFMGWLNNCQNNLKMTSYSNYFLENNKYHVLPHDLYFETSLKSSGSTDDKENLFCINFKLYCKEKHFSTLLKARSGKLMNEFINFLFILKNCD